MSTEPETAEAEVIPLVKSLPLNPEDGDQILDDFGNIFEFSAEENCWIFQGQLQDPDVVTEEQDGLVSTDIFDLISQIQDLSESGVSFDKTKLFTGRALDSGSPYFYLFHSSDKLVKFSPELTTDLKKRLRIEVNHPGLIARFQGLVCNGPKGPKGLKGDAGEDGEAAANEVFRDPTSLTETTFELSAIVAAPIDTPISIRIFQDEVQKIEIKFPVSAADTAGTAPIQDLEITTAEGFTVEVSATDVIYDLTSEQLTAIITLSEGEFDDFSEWQFKARQVGPDGRDGEDGDDFLEIVQDFFDDSSIRFSEAIVSMRKSSLDDNLFFTKSRLFDEICVGRLRSTAGALPIGRITDSNFAAVELTTESCKRVGFFQFKPEEFQPDLELPQWVPTKQCNDRRRFELANFDWFKQTSPSIPFTFLIDPEPPERCCQDKFFFCPNLGDACEIKGQPQGPATGREDTTSTSTSSLSSPSSMSSLSSLSSLSSESSSSSAPIS